MRFTKMFAATLFLPLFVACEGAMDAAGDLEAEAAAATACLDPYDRPNAVTQFGSWEAAHVAGDDYGPCGMIHEAQGVVGPTHAMVSWDDVALGSSEACGEASIGVKIYRQDPATLKWSKLREIKKAGTVNPNGTCGLFDALYFDAGSRPTKVRTVVSAQLRLGGSAKNANVHSSVNPQLN